MGVKSKMTDSTTCWERLKQQRLSAWQPSYTIRTTSPLLILFGVILIPLGVAIFIVSRNVQEINLDYTNCPSTNSGGMQCSDMPKNDSCTCRLKFRLDSDMKGEIRMYYGLTNFYQNHREYVSSKDNDQLLGKVWESDKPVSPHSDCEPFDKDDETGKFYFPCGAIANSMFSDEFKLYYHDKEDVVRPVSLRRTGIAWESDKQHKFKNPSLSFNDPKWETHFTKPKDWKRPIWELDPENPDNTGLQNEDFIVWMRVSALPNFRKLYRIIDSSSVHGKSEGLPAGDYTVEVDYNFEVKSFDGTKSFILAEHTFFGGKNLPLGILMMSTGSVVLFFGLIFLLGSMRGKKRSWTRRSLILKNYGTQGSTILKRTKNA